MTPKITDSLEIGLAIYYLLVALMNLGFAAYFFHGPKKKGIAAIWAARRASISSLGAMPRTTVSMKSSSCDLSALPDRATSSTSS